jgi:signal transduction histidine kinase
MERESNPAYRAPSLEAARLRALVQNLGFGVLVEDEARRVSLANEAFCRLFGIPLSPAALVGADCAEASHGVARLVMEGEGFVERIESLIAARRPVLGDEIRFRDGRILERDYVPIEVDSEGRGHVWVYRDVTHVRGLSERKRAEGLLAGEKRVLEMVARGYALPEVLATLCRVVEAEAGEYRCSVMIVDRTGAHLEIGAAPSLPGSYNSAIRAMLAAKEWGPCPAAVSLKSQIIVSDVLSDSRWDSSGWRELALLHGFASCWSTPILSADQRVLGTFALYGTAAGLPTEEQKELIEQFTHLTSVIIERKHSEEALASAQAELSHVTRVTTLGELAASIAHEINQPLSAMVVDAVACLNWLAKDPPELERARESLAAIVSDGERAGAILTRIRALLSRSSVAHRRCDLHHVVASALELMRPELLRNGIRLERRFAGETVAVSGDPVELQQVILNLVLNAADAERELGPERRVVVVSTSLEQLGGKPYAIVSIEDAGVGIDETAFERLFAPFYTTKPGGLGMGLSIIRSIAERHGGSISARSNPGFGATFRFSLPAASDDGAAE